MRSYAIFALGMYSAVAMGRWAVDRSGVVLKSTGGLSLVNGNTLRMSLMSRVQAETNDKPRAQRWYSRRTCSITAMVKSKYQMDRHLHHHHHSQGQRKDQDHGQNQWDFIRRIRGGKGAYGKKIKNSLKFKKFMLQTDGDYYIHDEERDMMKYEVDDEKRRKTWKEKAAERQIDHKLEEAGEELAEHMKAVSHNRKMMKINLKKEREKKDLLRDTILNDSDAQLRAKKQRLRYQMEEDQEEKGGGQGTFDPAREIKGLSSSSMSSNSDIDSAIPRTDGSLHDDAV